MIRQTEGQIEAREVAAVLLFDLVDVVLRKQHRALRTAPACRDHCR
jgi:hypothetical protein